MECNYLLVILQPDGGIQVDAFLPDDAEQRAKVGEVIIGAVVNHFQQMEHTDHNHGNGHRKVPTSGVDVPSAGVQQA